MSRHYFDCLCEGQKLRVILGYDKPLHELFMNVEHLTREGASTMNYRYASISDPDSNGELDYYADKLEALGISAPDSLFFGRIGVGLFGLIGTVPEVSPRSEVR